MRRTIFQLATFCLFSVVATEAAQASLMDFLGVTNLSDRTTDAMNSILTQRIDQFLGGMDQLSGQMINDGSNQGKLLLVQAGNEMQLTISTIRSQFAGEMDRTIDKASKELRPLLDELEKWRVVQNELASKVVELEDTVAMDLDRIPFTKDYFGVRRAYGTVLVPDADIYRVHIIGPHFGQVVPNEVITVTADLDGIDLGPPSQVPPNGMEFVVPAAAVKDKFETDKITSVPLHLTLKRIENGWLWNTKTVLKQDLRVSLLPKIVGILSIETQRPKFDWVTTGVQADSAVIRADKVFNLSVGRPVVTDVPREGDERLAQPAEAHCDKVSQNARRFPNGKIVLESDEIFTRGWFVPFWIGADEGPDWDRSNRSAFDTWGINVSFWRMQRCRHNDHCYLTPNELRDRSALTQILVDDCARMRMAETNWLQNNSRVSIWVRGAATQDSLWKVSAPVETYRQISVLRDQSKVFNVAQGQLLQIEVDDPEGTLTTVNFVPKNGKSIEGQAGLSLAEGPQFQGAADLGSRKRIYMYRFTYDTSRWDRP
ncbi:hypothetical protein ACCS61_32605 [Rhizobium ruizarguesonis]